MDEFDTEVDGLPLLGLDENILNLDKLDIHLSGVDEPLLTDSLSVSSESLNVSSIAMFTRCLSIQFTKVNVLSIFFCATFCTISIKGR